MVSDDMLIHLSTAQGQNKLAIMLANYLTRDELLEIDLHGMTEFWREHQGRAFQNSPEGIKNNNTIYKIKFAQTQSTLKLSMRLKSAVSPYDLTALDCILFEINYRGKFDVEIKVSPKDIENDQSRIMWGTMRALINNAVVGASVGFSKTLEFKGVGYKIALKGSKLDMVIGFSHNVEYDLPSEVKAEVVSPTELKLTSANKELLGLVASEIRSFRVPEPYKGKGIRYSDEYVRRKEGKKK